jgi:hypothetical protein
MTTERIKLRPDPGLPGLYHAFYQSRRIGEINQLRDQLYLVRDNDKRILSNTCTSLSQSVEVLQWNGM